MAVIILSVIIQPSKRCLQNFVICICVHKVLVNRGK